MKIDIDLALQVHHQFGAANMSIVIVLIIAPLIMAPQANGDFFTMQEESFGTQLYKYKSFMRIACIGRLVVSLQV